MPKFEVELKKIVDDSYEIEIGHGLLDRVVEDLFVGVAGKLHKFAIITDSNVEPLYARPLEQKLLDAGQMFLCSRQEKKVRHARQRR